MSLPLSITVTVAGGQITGSRLEILSHSPLAITILGDECSSELREDIHQWINAYLVHKTPAKPLPLYLPSFSPFTRQVLATLQKIPHGHTRSYGEVARALENPRAARAVGSACGQNPLPLFIPCHRVVRTGGGLGGFSAGLPIKRLLLEHEKLA